MKNIKNIRVSQFIFKPIDREDETKKFNGFGKDVISLVYQQDIDAHCQHFKASTNF